MTVEEKTSGVVAVEQGQTAWVITDFERFIIKGEETGGRYSMIEVTSLSQSSPPPHIHHTADEDYYILEGEYEFYDLNKNHTFKATPGMFIRIHKGTAHTYKNTSEGYSRMLVIDSPAGFEGFLETIGVPSNDLANPPVIDAPPDLEALAALAAKFDTSLALPK